MKKCPQCGAEANDAARFCPRDGAVLDVASEPTSADPMIGRVIANRYRIADQIGRGGMGSVYRAEHVRMRRKTAIKILSTELSSNPEFVARFEREAELASTINHPNAVSIYDFGETEEGLVYLAMELLDGEPLSAVLRRRGTLPLEEVVAITRQAAAALNAAHKLGIVHRDFKPDNVMICRGPDGEQVVKVVDFGIAKQTRLSHAGGTLTQTGSVLGTPIYMSPEQVADQPLDNRSDLYSLALTVYEMLSRRIPFAGDTPQSLMVQRLVDPPIPLRAVAPDVPAVIEAVVMRALSKSRDERHPSTVEFAADLARASEAGRTTAVDAVTSPTTIPSPPPRYATPASVTPITAPVQPPFTPSYGQPTPPPPPVRKQGAVWKIVAVAAVVVLFLGSGAIVGVWAMWDTWFASPPPVGPGPMQPPRGLVPSQPNIPSFEGAGGDGAAAATAASYLDEVRGLRDVEDFAAAEQKAREAISAFPDAAASHAALAEALIDQARYGEATAAAERAVELDSASADAHQALAACRVSQGAYPESIAAAKRALSLSPSPDCAALAHLTIGGSSLEAQRYVDADAAFRAAAELSKRHLVTASAAVGLAEIRARKGDVAGAIADMLPIAKESSYGQNLRAGVYVRVGRLQFMQGQSAPALASAEVAYDLATLDVYRAAARVVQSFVYSKVNEPSDALDAAEEAVAKSGEDRYIRAYALVAKGIALAQLGQIPEAREALAQAKRILPGDPEIAQVLELLNAQAR